MCLFTTPQIFLDVAAEKTEKALIAGIEHFDPSKLKHTETNEKNPLPDKDGELFLIIKALNYFKHSLLEHVLFK